MKWLLDHHEEIRNLGLVAAAAIGLPLAIWRSFIAQKQAKVQADNHLAETFTKAIDQLGKKEDEVQLGGLYALEKIAYSKKEYHRQILEVLCSFVRLHSQKKICVNDEKPKNEENEDSILSPPEVIVQTALTIIGRRNIDFDFLAPNANKDDSNQDNQVSIDLNNTYLIKSDLKEANLRRANFQKAFLQNASLQKANLEDAKLSEACLQKAKLEGANLQEANLKRTNLEGANLVGAILYEANLSGANISLEQLQSAKVFKSTVLPDHINKNKVELED